MCCTHKQAAVSGGAVVTTCALAVAAHVAAVVVSAIVWPVVAVLFACIAGGVWYLARVLRRGLVEFGPGVTQKERVAIAAPVRAIRAPGRAIEAPRQAMPYVVLADEASTLKKERHTA